MSHWLECDIDTCVLAKLMAMPIMVEKAWVMENIFPKWYFGTHLLRIDRAGDPLLPLRPDKASPKYMCQPFVAKAKTSWFSIPLMLPMMEMMQSWTWR